MKTSQYTHGREYFPNRGTCYKLNIKTSSTHKIKSHSFLLTSKRNLEFFFFSEQMLNLVLGLCLMPFRSLEIFPCLFETVATTNRNKVHKDFCRQMLDKLKRLCFAPWETFQNVNEALFRDQQNKY